MASDPERADPPKEIRLEGARLALAGVVALTLLYGAFALGRSVERRERPPAGGAPASDAEGEAGRESSERSEPVTFFDTTDAGQVVEPQREARSAPPQTAPPRSPPAGDPAGWFVQVFVGRDRDAAEQVVTMLRAKGYPVRADAVPEGGSGRLYKVRVGGYASRESAEAASVKLHADGQASTWVVRVGD